MLKQGYNFSQLQVGQSETVETVIKKSMIEAFAEVTGDTNPVHLDADYAAGTIFKEPIAHGMLSAGLISAVLGTRLPGPGAVYLSQSLAFKRPVKIGDTVVVTVTVTDKQERRRTVTFETVCTVNDKVVVTGEAVTQVPAGDAQP